MLHESFDYSIPTGSSYRISHCPHCIEQRGISKSSVAVSITREPNGFRWWCFRCNKGGMVYDKGAAPKDVLKRLASIKESIRKSPVVSKTIYLPQDLLYSEERIPNKFLTWIWNYGLEFSDIQKKYRVGYSPKFDRLCFPCYETDLIVPGSKGDLVGWAGRSETKPYKLPENPKWLIRRRMDIKNLIWAIENLDNRNTVVVVEDIVSAIKVVKAGFSAVSLIKSFVPPELLTALRGREIVLWLDPDMRGVVLKKVAQARAYGLKARIQMSTQDPKCYTTDQIRNKIIKEPI